MSYNHGDGCTCVQCERAHDIDRARKGKHVLTPNQKAYLRALDAWGKSGAKPDSKEWDRLQSIMDSLSPAEKRYLDRVIEDDAQDAKYVRRGAS